MEKKCVGRLKKGVSGIMRVKDDAEFIEACVESCIDALDELIIVYNDCTDNSPEVIKMMQKRYPDKIKVFPYNYHIYALNLTQQEYEYALSLPKDSPHLLCNYYNFALSKVSYQYALKIDADQIYFTEKLKDLCDVVKSKEKKINWKVIIGLLVFIWSIVTKRMNLWSGYVLPLLPSQMSSVTRKCYDCFLKYCVTRNVNLSLSGINLFFTNDEWLVPLGMKNDSKSILPPFNGVGDHLFFRMIDGCFYEKYDCKEYSTLRNDQYTLIEKFIHPHRTVSAGFFWSHLNMMRNIRMKENARLVKLFPDRFIQIEKMSRMDYYKLDKLVDRSLFSIRARSLIQFCMFYDKSSLVKFLMNQ